MPYLCKKSFDMKKSILVVLTAVGTLALAAFSFLNKEDTTDLDLVYKVDSRHTATISKNDLHNATSVLDIVPKIATDWWKVEFQKVSVTVIGKDGEETRFEGNSKTLNAAQVMLLQSTDYSTNFYINASSMKGHPSTGERIDYAYYFTIIPENEAEYIGGHDKLINYLKEGTKDKTVSINQDQLKPGQVSFTVTKDGTVKNIKLLNTSGYPTIDEALLELISNMPEKWQPATNLKGESVEQELIFFFGEEGC